MNFKALLIIDNTIQALKALQEITKARAQSSFHQGRPGSVLFGLLGFCKRKNWKLKFLMLLVKRSKTRPQHNNSESYV